MFLYAAPFGIIFKLICMVYVHAKDRYTQPAIPASYQGYLL